MRDPLVPLRTILKNFLNHVENLETRRNSEDDQYEAEFQKLKLLSENLKSQTSYSTKEGEKDLNRKKNRYKDILPYDYSRVILSELPGVPCSDYVNANYIRGASGSMAYIASQGPLVNTITDFWRMVVETEVKVIIMACNEKEAGKHKCENYWPESESDSITHGNVTVSMIKSRQICSDFLLRTLKLQFMNDKGGKEERTVCQFHYSAWPDHGVPVKVRPLLDMVFLVRDVQSSETTPVLIHCSAGCGRTGTICAIDFVWGLFKSGKLNINFSLFDIISDMRRQRIAMVQTKEQYILVHRAVKEMFQEQLKVIDSHPYENIDSEGFPFMMHGSNKNEIGSLKDSVNYLTESDNHMKIDIPVTASNSPNPTKPSVDAKGFPDFPSSSLQNRKLTKLSRSETVGGFPTIGPIMGKTILMEKKMRCGESGWHTYHPNHCSRLSENSVVDSRGKSRPSKPNIMQLKAMFEQEMTDRNVTSQGQTRLSRSASSVGVGADTTKKPLDKCFRRDDILSKTMITRTHPVPPKRDKHKISKSPNRLENSSPTRVSEPHFSATNLIQMTPNNPNFAKKDDKKVVFETSDILSQTYKEKKDKPLEVKTFPLMKRSKSMKIRRFLENSKDFLVQSWTPKSEPKEFDSGYLNLELSFPQSHGTSICRPVQKLSNHHYEAQTPFIASVCSEKKSLDKNDSVRSKPTIIRKDLRDAFHPLNVPVVDENINFKVQNLRRIKCEKKKNIEITGSDVSEASSEEGFYHTPPSDPICDNHESSYTHNYSRPLKKAQGIFSSRDVSCPNSAVNEIQCDKSFNHEIICNESKWNSEERNSSPERGPLRLRERRNSYMQAVDNSTKVIDKKEPDKISSIAEEVEKPKVEPKKGRECEIVWFGNNDGIFCHPNHISDVKIKCQSQSSVKTGQNSPIWESNDPHFKLVPTPSASIKWFSEEDSSNLTDESKILKVKNNFNESAEDIDKHKVNCKLKSLNKSGANDFPTKTISQIDIIRFEEACSLQAHNDGSSLPSSIKRSQVKLENKYESDLKNESQLKSCAKPPLPSYTNLEAKFKIPPPWQPIALKANMNTNLNSLENKQHNPDCNFEVNKTLKSDLKISNKPLPPPYEEAIKPKIVGETAIIGETIVKLRPKKDKIALKEDANLTKPVAPPRIKRNSSSLTSKADIFGGSQPAVFPSEIADRNSGNRLSRLFKKFGDDEAFQKFEQTLPYMHPSDSAVGLLQPQGSSSNESTSKVTCNTVLSPPLKRSDIIDSVSSVNLENNNLTAPKSISKAFGRLHATAINFKQKLGAAVKAGEDELDDTNLQVDLQVSNFYKGFPKRFPSKTKGPREPPRNFRPRQEYI